MAMDCRCQHRKDQHGENRGPCAAPDSRYWFKKTDPTRPCKCARYRGSVLSMFADLLSGF